MTNNYDLIGEDFIADLDALCGVVRLISASKVSSKARVASINSAILLMAATFEEFIRQMGRQFAKDLVTQTKDPKKLPRKLPATAWRRTLEHLAREKIDTGGTSLSLEHISASSRLKFDTVCSFLGGDVSQDIYKMLIHNDNNMRPNEINSIFSVCGLSDVCNLVCKHEVMKEHYGLQEQGKVHGQFVTSLNDFMEMRNDIAHALNVDSSVGAETVYKFADEFKALAVALAAELPDHLPERALAEATH
ncbi:hypothetical protein EYD00_18925 [Agrobacterium sp. 33MFTa1.1]|uniref:HEPN domain-containing protein n=1 Tax=Agrobacterium sp. 33MFTa1.1 TaxID=1279031 RepID=UPI00054E8749|nr:HEPN domain-containing protein [Agrobacterium sp. 33MFTa1.1]QBJ15515.1 hypothetical protein EYD00_18925 [Agrobacterium sp. 33MFTa1.1]